MTTARTYFRCPECGKKGVTLRIAAPKYSPQDMCEDGYAYGYEDRYEDSWTCRYCRWSVYDGERDGDQVGLRALSKANPEHTTFWWDSNPLMQQQHRLVVRAGYDMLVWHAVCSCGWFGQELLGAQSAWDEGHDHVAATSS